MDDRFESDLYVMQDLLISILFIRFTLPYFLAMTDVDENVTKPIR